MHASSGRAAWEVCQMLPIMSLEHWTPETKWIKFWQSVLHAAGVLKGTRDTCKCPLSAGWGKHCKEEKLHREGSRSCQMWILEPKWQKQNKFSILQEIFNFQLLWMGFWTILNPCNMHASRNRLNLQVVLCRLHAVSAPDDPEIPCVPVAELHEKCARCLQSCLLNSQHPKQNELSFDGVFCMLQVFWRAPGTLASAHWVLGGGSTAKWKSCTGRDPEASKCESWTLNNKNKINLVFWEQSLILSCSGWAPGQFWILAPCAPAVAELHEKCARCLQSCLLNTGCLKQNELSFNGVSCMLQVFWRAPGTLASAHWVPGGGSTAKWKSCTGRDSEAFECESWTLNNKNKIN